MATTYQAQMLETFSEVVTYIAESENPRLLAYQVGVAFGLGFAREWTSGEMAERCGVTVEDFEAGVAGMRERFDLDGEDDEEEEE